MLREIELRVKVKLESYYATDELLSTQYPVSQTVAIAIHDACDCTCHYPSNSQNATSHNLPQVKRHNPKSYYTTSTINTKLLIDLPRQMS